MIDLTLNVENECLLVKLWIWP